MSRLALFLFYSIGGQHGKYRANHNLLTESLKDMAIEHAVQQSINNVEKIKKQVEETLKIPTDISNKIYFDKQLKALVSKEYESNLEVLLPVVCSL